MTKSTNAVNGGAMPKIGPNSGRTRDRSQFIGGSDARTITAPARSKNRDALNTEIDKLTEKKSTET